MLSMFRWLRFWDRRRNPPKTESRPPQHAQPKQPTSPPVHPPERPRLFPPEYESLLRALEDPSPEVRGRAAEALAGVGAPVVPALAEMLTHETAHVRHAAALPLGDMGPGAAPALTALVRAAIDRDESVRQAASQALARVDPAWAISPATRLAIPALIDGLRNELPRVSRAATALLLRVGRPAVPALVELLAGWEKEAHRTVALRILEQFGPSAAEAAPALADLLGDSAMEVRLAAAEVLAKVGAGARPAVPALIRTLSDWSPAVRRSAARALAGVGPAAAHAVPTLLGLLADYDDGVRDACAAALGGIGEPAVPLVAQVLGERDLARFGRRAGFREEVDRLWRRLDVEGACPVPDSAWRDLTWAAREGLREQVEAVHQAAATALGRAGPAAVPAVPALVQALSGASDPVGQAAARALGEIGPAARTALPHLAAVLVNGTPGVQKAAAEALARIDADWGAADLLTALVARLPEDGPRAAEAADALVMIGANSAPALVRALASTDQAASEAAARTLGRIGPAARWAVPSLTAALRDPRGAVREAAAQALARVAPDRLVGG